MAIVAVLLSVISIVLFVSGAVILIVSLKDGRDISHPGTTIAVTVVGLLGTAYGFSIAAAESFSFTFGLYLQTLGCAALLFLAAILLAFGITSLVDHLG